MGQFEKYFKICTNKKKLITDNQENIQVDYIINCYDKHLPYTPSAKTYIVKKNLIDYHM